MTEPPETLVLLARESARVLAELGVRSDDEGWIREHSKTIASLTRRARPRWKDYVRRLARSAARKAR